MEQLWTHGSGSVQRMMSYRSELCHMSHVTVTCVAYTTTVTCHLRGDVHYIHMYNVIDSDIDSDNCCIRMTYSCTIDRGTHHILCMTQVSNAFMQTCCIVNVQIVAVNTCSVWRFSQVHLASTCHPCRPSLTQAVSLVKTAAKALPPLGYSPLRGYFLLRGYPSSEEPPDIADSAAVPEEELVAQPSEEGDSREEGDSHDGTFDLEPRNHMFYNTAGNVGQVKVLERLDLL